MCLILLAVSAHPDYPLVIAANRDEFYARPTAPASQWKDGSGIFGGRDLEQGGTWLGVTRSGRWAAISNFRGSGHTLDAPSRGFLVTDYLRSSQPPDRYLERLTPTLASYNGFSLLAGNAGAVCFVSNRGDGVHIVAPGVHGLSNDLLDTPWPKVERGKLALESVLSADALEPERLLELLRDDRPAADDTLPDTGIGLERERALSPLFVRGPSYGTRCSAAFIVDKQGNANFAERSFDKAGESGQTIQLAFPVG
ncbi:MAG: NRDE family protein [Gammaproteobacteria bacterium]